MEISASASKFTKNDIKQLKVKYTEDIDKYEKIDVPEYFLIKDYEKIQIMNADDKILNTQEMSLCCYINDIIINETLTVGTDESKTSNFIRYILTRLNFDEYPFILQAHPKYTFRVGDDDIAAVPDYGITKNGNILFIDEDKHIKNISTPTKYGEYQIAGEMIASAWTNKFNRRMKKRKNIHSSTIFALRVIGTQFTFYKAYIDDDYLDELEENDLYKDLIIYRYPSDDSYEYASSLDYCIPNERKLIMERLLNIKTVMLNM